VKNDRPREHPRYDAAIFDLFGTLVNNFSARLHNDVVIRMAAILGAQYDAFAVGWNETTWPQRVTGELPTVEANLVHVCRALGLDVGVAQITAAADTLLTFTRAALAPRRDAGDTLAALKARGLTIGLVSDCGPAVPLLWPETPFASLIDVPIFSCAVGLKKPDPRIYGLACERLGVQAPRCLYVGDGSSQELSGAQRVGMRAVLVRCNYDDSYDVQRLEVMAWQGPAITTLGDVVSLVDDEDR